MTRKQTDMQNSRRMENHVRDMIGMEHIRYTSETSENCRNQDSFYEISKQFVTSSFNKQKKKMHSTGQPTLMSRTQGGENDNGSV